MSWGNITGDEKILPSSGSNEVVLESGKVKKVRLLLAPGEEPYSFFQHSLEVERVENGQTVRVFRTVNCPKTKSNPYAPCKLCDGQRAQRRVRHSSRAWDYESGCERYLTGGQKIYSPIATLQKMGIDPTSVDFAVLRTGQGRNDTDYSVQNLGQSQFALPADTNHIQSPENEYRPHSEEEMREIVESIGLSWAEMITPPPLQYPQTLQDALNHVVPNTKYKNQTMKQIYDANPGMIEFFANSNRVTEEKAAAQVILVALRGANIPGVPNYANGGTITPATQPAVNTTVSQPVQPAVNTTVSQPVQPAGGVVSNTGDRQARINSINQLLQSNDKFVKGGYQVIIETMKQASGGKVAITEFTDAELDKMLELCK